MGGPHYRRECLRKYELFIPSIITADLNEFVKLYNPANPYGHKPTWSEKSLDGRWRAYDYEEVISRDKASLDIFWLKDESLEDSDNLPYPGVLAQEIVDDLEAALEQLRAISEDLGSSGNPDR